MTINPLTPSDDYDKDMLFHLLETLAHQTSYDIIFSLKNSLLSSAFDEADYDNLFNTVHGEIINALLQHIHEGKINDE